MAEYSNLFVVSMGMGVVFFGLISIILLTMAMGCIKAPVISPSGEDGGTNGPEKESQAALSPAASPAGTEIAAIITAVLFAEIGAEKLQIIDIRKC